MQYPIEYCKKIIIKLYIVQVFPIFLRVIPFQNQRIDNDINIILFNIFIKIIIFKFQLKTKNFFISIDKNIKPNNVSIFFHQEFAKYSYL